MRGRRGKSETLVPCASAPTQVTGNSEPRYGLVICPEPGHDAIEWPQGEMQEVIKW